MLSIANRNTIDSKRGGLTGLNKIFASYNFTNMWSSENLTVSGTTTTLHDYASEHDLSNPSAVNQPSFNSSGGVGSESKPSLTFVTNDILSKSITDYRGSDSSGVFISVLKVNSGTNIFDIGIWDSTQLANYVNQTSTISSKYRFLHNSGVIRVASGTSDVLTGSPNLVTSSACSGSAYYIVINGVSETLAFTSGTNDGAVWLDSTTGRDSLAIGGRLSNSPAYGNLEWCMGGYMPFVSEANIIAVQEELKTYYGI